MSWPTDPENKEAEPPFNLPAGMAAALKERAEAPSFSTPPPASPPPSSASESANIEEEKKKAELHSFRQDVELRREYADKIYCLIVGWIIAIFAVLILQGVGSPSELFSMAGFSMSRKMTFFSLSDGVLIALISGTTASVIGLFVFVASYLFPKKDSDKTKG